MVMPTNDEEWCLDISTLLASRSVVETTVVGPGQYQVVRTEKHKQRKLEQYEYISTTVDKILKDYLDQNKLKEGELDNGALSFCKRRSAATVEAALSQYIEQRAERELQNPSAFLWMSCVKLQRRRLRGMGMIMEKERSSARNVETVVLRVKGNTHPRLRLWTFRYPDQEDVEN